MKPVEMTMLNPCHPGETLRDDVQASGLTITEVASRRVARARPIATAADAPVVDAGGAVPPGCTRQAHRDG